MTARRSPGSGAALRVLRRQFGMVFQQFNLVKRLSVLTNVLTGRLAYRSTWRSLFYNFSREDKRIAIECLARVNMEHKAFQRADTLSGGEQQRVAIARALAQQPTHHSRRRAGREPRSEDRPPGADLSQAGRAASSASRCLCNLHQVEYTREFAERIIGMSRGKVVFEGTAADLTDEILHRIYYRDPDEKDDEGPMSSRHLRERGRRARCGARLQVRWRRRDLKLAAGARSRSRRCGIRRSRSSSARSRW